jgi:hypothetical protein
MYKFHAHSGWFFHRDNSDVVISRGDAFEATKEIVRFDGNTWASIVASVSAAGETAETFKAALNLHGNSN